MNLSFFIARRYLVKQKGTFSSFIIKLAIVATALSVAVMIMSIAVVMGFKYSISEKLYSFMGHVHVAPYNETNSNAVAFSEPIYFDRTLLADLKKVKHVTSASPFIIRPVIVQVKGNMEGVQLKGVDKDYRFLQGITQRGPGIDYSDSSYSKQIILSQTTAERLIVNIGDTVQLNFIQEGALRIRRVRVNGIYHSGMDDVDKFFGVCDIRLLQRINGWPADSINGYQVDIDNAKFADTVSNFIHYNLINAPLASYTTKESYSFIFDWLDLQSISGGILLALMAVVSIINMGAVLLILIVDRARMIGLFKALGMPFEMTRNVFLAIAALIGGTGILAGNVLALGFYWVQSRFGVVKLPEHAYYMKYAPVKIIWWQVAVIDVATLLLCILCMWLPALYIKRVSPARVLQFK